MDRLKALLQGLRDARFRPIRAWGRRQGYAPQEVDDLLDHVEQELAAFLNNTTDVTRHKAGHEEEGE